MGQSESKSFNFIDVLAGTSTGWNFLNSSSFGSVMERLGVGMTTYFKFVK
jgi:hypothetical protein